MNLKNSIPYLMLQIIIFTISIPFVSNPNQSSRFYLTSPHFSSSGPMKKKTEKINYSHLMIIGNFSCFVIKHRKFAGAAPLRWRRTKNRNKKFQKITAFFSIIPANVGNTARINFY